MKGEETIATVTKKWFSFGDSYTLDVAEDKNVVPALCVMVALDCIFEDGAAAAAGGAAAAGAYTHHQNNARTRPRRIPHRPRNNAGQTLREGPDALPAFFVQRTPALGGGSGKLVAMPRTVKPFSVKRQRVEGKLGQRAALGSI